MKPAVVDQPNTTITQAQVIDTSEYLTTGTVSLAIHYPTWRDEQLLDLTFSIVGTPIYGWQPYNALAQWRLNDAPEHCGYALVRLEKSDD